MGNDRAHNGVFSGLPLTADVPAAIALLSSGQLLRICSSRLRCRPDDDFVDIHIRRLRDGESDSARDRVRRNRHLVAGGGQLDPEGGFRMKSVRTNPGVTIVTRSLSPASWRNPSQNARTANFVAE